MNTYEQKQQEKKERYISLAEKFREDSNTLYTTGSGALKRIPFGQPLLVDHYSYKSDKSY